MAWIYIFAAACFVYNAAYAVHCIKTRQTFAALGAVLLFAVSVSILFLV